MGKKKVLLFIVLCLTPFIYIHRRVIRSMLTGEPLPENPHKCHSIKGAEDV